MGSLIHDADAVTPSAHNPADVIAELRQVKDRLCVVEALLRCYNEKIDSGGSALALLEVTDSANECLRRGEQPLALAPRYTEQIVLRRGLELAATITQADFVDHTLAQFQADPAALPFGLWTDYLMTKDGTPKGLHPRISDPGLQSTEVMQLRMTFRMMTAAEEGCLKTMTAAVCACLRRVNQLKPQANVDYDHEDWSLLQRYAAAWADATLGAMRGLEGPEAAALMQGSLANYRKVLLPDTVPTGELKTAVGDVEAKTNVFAKAYLGPVYPGLGQTSWPRAGAESL